MESDVLPRRACRVAILWQLKTARHIGGIAGLGQVGELLVKRLAGARTEKGIAISGICNRGRRHCSQRVAFRIGVMRYRNARVKEMWSWLRGEGRRCRRKSDTISKCHRCCAMRIAVVDESNTARWIFQSGEAKSRRLLQPRLASAPRFRPSPLWETALRHRAPRDYQGGSRSG